MAKKPFPFSVCENCCRDGLSAYEIAKQNGFEGTEEEWLESLHADCDGYTKTEVDEKFEQNALKGNASGNPVAVTDVSEISHNVGVKVSSKNIIDMSIFDKYVYSNGSANTYDATAHTITMDVDAANSSSGRYKRLLTNDTSGKKYTLSFEVRGTEGRKIGAGAEHSPISITLTNEFKRYSQVISVKATNNNIDMVFFSKKASDGGLLAGEYMQFANIQLEEGITLTDYTPFVDVSGADVTLAENGNTYTTDDNGEFECESISPNMTFSCESDVIINCEYNKDINKAFAELQNAIISLGGNV